MIELFTGIATLVGAFVYWIFAMIFPRSSFNVLLSYIVVDKWPNSPIIVIIILGILIGFIIDIHMIEVQYNEKKK